MVKNLHYEDRLSNPSFRLNPQNGYQIKPNRKPFDRIKQKIPSVKILFWVLILA